MSPIGAYDSEARVSPRALAAVDVNNQNCCRFHPKKLAAFLKVIKAAPSSIDRTEIFLNLYCLIFYT